MTRPRILSHDAKILKPGDVVYIMNDFTLFKDHLLHYPNLPILGMNGLRQFLGKRVTVQQTDSDDGTAFLSTGQQRFWLPTLTLLTVPSTDRPESEALELYDKLLTDDSFKDLTFRLQDGVVTAHKCMLSAASSAFASMLSGQMKESSTGVVEMPDVCKASMLVFLRLLYTGHVDAEDWGQASGKMPLNILLDTHRLGRKYMVDGIVETTAEALKARLADPDADLDTFQSVLSMAIKNDIGALRLAAAEAARNKAFIRSAYDDRKLQPEVQAELQGIWPVAERKAGKRKWAKLE